MNKENIINAATAFFDNVIPYRDNENVYRAELKMGKAKAAAVYYIDLNEKVSLEQFDEYQESLLAKDYYNEPGDIQWNYYLLLLRDQVTEGLKQYIERNDKYARKYVFDEMQFQNFFRAERSNQGVDLDFVNTIKQKLDGVGLDEVYGDKTYTEAVQNFVGGNNASSGRRRNVQSSKEQIHFVNSLHLTSDYRKFPLQRNFQFGKVNLIEGKNGIGKTSLMEAIELSICGKTYRNPAITEVEGCVEVVFNNGDLRDKCMPSQNTKYRSRDFAWYANAYASGNYLHQSFQRFNFFNADAAQEFATSNNEEQIRKSLLNIILGTEYTYIADRIKGFHNQYRAFYNSFIRDYNSAIKVLKQSEQIIETSTNSANVESHVISILEAYKDLDFVNASWSKENIAEIEQLNNNLLSGLNQLQSYSREGIFSKADALNLIAKNQQQRLLLEEFQEYLGEVDAKIRNTAGELDSVSSQVSLLSAAVKYCNVEWLSDLKGSQARLSLLTDSNQKLKWALDKINGIDLSAFKSDLSSDAMVSSLSSELISAAQSEQQLQLQIDEHLSLMQKKEALISEIKALGNRYIHEHAQATDCPLCQSSFTESIELQQRIETLVAGQSSSAQAHLDQLKAQLQVQKDRHSNAVKSKTEFELLVLAYSKLVGTYNAVKVSELVQYLSNVSIVLERQNEEAAALQSMLDMAEIAQVSEKELLEIEEALQMNFPYLVLSNENKIRFINKRSELELNIKDLSTRMRQYESDKESRIFKFKQELEIKTEAFTIQIINEQLLIADRLLKTVMELVEGVEKIINLKSKQFFESLLVQAATLSKNINALREEQQNEFVLNEAKRKKAEAEAFLDKNNSNKEKFEQAMNILETLISDAGNDEMVAFFNQNMAEILDVFMTIHAPRDFTSIIFDRGELILVTKDMAHRSVRQISTGQRSALALSIFITMNRKLKYGPNIIMFDDPVAFIDDLNSLSFLDYLRYFVLKEGKQIFFATANAHLADLFEKKFSFMELDFQKHFLSRAES